MAASKVSRRSVIAAGLALAWAATANADHMPSKEEGMAMRAQTQDYIAENGIEEAIAAIQENKPPFDQGYPAVAIHRVKEGRFILKAHTLYKELVGADLTEIEDLEGRQFIQDFFEKVKAGGGAAPTTNAPPPDGIKHKAECYNEWARGYDGAYFIDVCYARPGSDGG